VIWSSHGARRPRRLIVLAIAALIPVLAGCEAGNDAPTNQWHQPTAGAGTTVGDIAIRNVFVLGAVPGAHLAVGQSAGLFLAVVNGTSPDRLLSASAPGAARSVTLPGGTISLSDNQAVFLTGPEPKVILNHLTRPLSGSTYIRLIMTFQNAGSVTLLVPVLPRASFYATLSPAPTPAPVITKRRKVIVAIPTPKVQVSTPTPSTSP
jgi:hypothetical protein